MGNRRDRTTKQSSAEASSVTLEAGDVSGPKSMPDPEAMMRMIDYLIPEARMVSPVTTMLLTLARKELRSYIECASGSVLPIKKRGGKPASGPIAR